MPSTAKCPPPERLRLLLEGVASDDLQTELTAHLDSCLECRQALEEMASSGATVAAIARNLGNGTPARDVPLQEAIRKLQDDPHLAETVTNLGQGEAPSLDFLQPSLKPGHL